MCVQWRLTWGGGGGGGVAKAPKSLQAPAPPFKNCSPLMNAEEPTRRGLCRTIRSSSGAFLVGQGAGCTRRVGPGVEDMLGQGGSGRGLRRARVTARDSGRQGQGGEVQGNESGPEVRCFLLSSGGVVSGGPSGERLPPSQGQWDPVHP